MIPMLHGHMPEGTHQVALAAMVQSRHSSYLELSVRFCANIAQNTVP